MNEMICLQVKNGKRRKQYSFKKKQIAIGRAKENDLVIENQYISRKHACIFQEKEKYILKPLSSPNQIFINQYPITKDWYLKDGDVIFLSGAAVEIRFSKKRLSNHPLNILFKKVNYKVWFSIVFCSLVLFSLYWFITPQKVNFKKQFITEQLTINTPKQALFMLFQLEDNFFLKAFENKKNTLLTLAKYDFKKRTKAFSQKPDTKILVAINSKYQVESLNFFDLLDIQQKNIQIDYQHPKTVIKEISVIEEASIKDEITLTIQHDRAQNWMEDYVTLTPDTFLLYRFETTNLSPFKKKISKLNTNGRLLSEEIQIVKKDHLYYTYFTAIGDPIYQLKKVLNSSGFVKEIAYKGFNQAIDIRASIIYDKYFSPIHIHFTDGKQKHSFTFEYNYNPDGTWNERIDKYGDEILHKIEITSKAL